VRRSTQPWQDDLRAEVAHGTCRRRERRHEKKRSRCWPDRAGDLLSLISSVHFRLLCCESFLLLWREIASAAAGATFWAARRNQVGSERHAARKVVPAWDGSRLNPAAARRAKQPLDAAAARRPRAHRSRARGHRTAIRRIFRGTPPARAPGDGPTANGAEEEGRGGDVARPNASTTAPGGAAFHSFRTRRAGRADRAHPAGGNHRPAVRRDAPPRQGGGGPGPTVACQPPKTRFTAERDRQTGALVDRGPQAACEATCGASGATTSLRGATHREARRHEKQSASARTGRRSETRRRKRRGRGVGARPRAFPEKQPPPAPEWRGMPRQAPGPAQGCTWRLASDFCEPLCGADFPGPRWPGSSTEAKSAPCWCGRRRIFLRRSPGPTRPASGAGSPVSRPAARGAYRRRGSGGSGNQGPRRPTGWPRAGKPAGTATMNLLPPASRAGEVDRVQVSPQGGRRPGRRADRS